MLCDFLDFIQLFIGKPLFLIEYIKFDKGISFIELILFIKHLKLREVKYFNVNVIFYTSALYTYLNFKQLHKTIYIIQPK